MNVPFAADLVPEYTPVAELKISTHASAMLFVPSVTVPLTVLVVEVGMVMVNPSFPSATTTIPVPWVYVVAPLVAAIAALARSIPGI